MSEQGRSEFSTNIPIAIPTSRIPGRRLLRESGLLPLDGLIGVTSSRLGMDNDGIFWFIIQ